MSGHSQKVVGRSAESQHIGFTFPTIYIYMYDIQYYTYQKVIDFKASMSNV